VLKTGGGGVVGVARAACRVFPSRAGRVVHPRVASSATWRRRTSTMALSRRARRAQPCYVPGDEGGQLDLPDFVWQARQARLARTHVDRSAADARSFAEGESVRTHALRRASPMDPWRIAESREDASGPRSPACAAIRRDRGPRSRRSDPRRLLRTIPRRTRWSDRQVHVGGLWPAGSPPAGADLHIAAGRSGSVSNTGGGMPALTHRPRPVSRSE